MTKANGVAAAQVVPCPFEPPKLRKAPNVRAILKLQCVAQMPCEQVLPRTHMLPDNCVEVVGSRLHKRLWFGTRGSLLAIRIIYVYNFTPRSCVKVHIILDLRRPHVAHIFPEILAYDDDYSDYPCP